MQEVGPHHLRQPAKLAHHIGADLLVDLDKRDRLATLLAPSQMEGRDIDAVAPAQAAKVADETRLVVIAKIQKRVREVGFDGDRLHLDDPRLVAADKRAGDGAVPLA